MIYGWLFATMGSPAAAPAALAAISSVQCTRVSNGTGCGAGLGTRYTVTWSANASVTDALHDVKIYMSGGGGAPTATQTIPQTVQSVDITSDEANDAGGNPVTYSLSYELILTSGPTVLQSGLVTPIPNASRYDINTSCPV